jgi:hypothetical protein
VNILTLNLASRPFRNNTVIGSVLATAVGVLVLATAANLYVFFTYRSSYARLQTEQRAERTRLHSLEAEERRLVREIEGRDFRSLHSQGRFAGELILRQSFSWTLLFNKLEELMPPEVMMAAIRPNITGDGIVIRVDGVAKHQGAFLTLQERLLASPYFARVYPAGERRLNPTRPEHSFTLNFDYLPDEPSAPAVVVASSGSPVTGAGTPAGDTPGRGAEEAGAAPAVAGSSPPPRTAPEGEWRDSDLRATVGRDGRSRTPEILARMTVAPGGIFVPEGNGSAAEPEGEVKRGGARETIKRNRDASARDADAQRARQESRALPRRTGTLPANPRKGPQGTAAPGGGASPSERPSRAGSRRPATASAESGKRAKAPVPLISAPKEKRNDPSGTIAEGASRPAVRLDVPLKFESSPVREVYASLEKAHSVSFEIDPGVDGGALVTADLSGKQLAAALAEVARAAGHSVTRRPDGIYRVVALSGGASITDETIQEEALSSEGAP